MSRFRDENGHERSFVLLTPPDMVAVRHADGTWTRQFRRDGDVDDPPPYTEDWYQEYLRHSGLPCWFLRPSHIMMLEDDAESRLLGLDNQASSTVVPVPGYLDHMYPFPPAYPIPNSGHDGAYTLGNVEQRQPHLARRFPATNVEGMESVIVVLPSGHIQLRRDINGLDLPTADAMEIEWMEEFDGSVAGSFTPQRMLASYRWETNHPQRETHLPRAVIGDLNALPLPRQTPVASPPRRVPRDRTDEVEEAREHGGIVNPSRNIWGLGRLTFLDPTYDHQSAVELGFNTPNEVNNARMRGDLPHGFGTNAGPFVVFWPDRRFRNPIEQPQGHGTWRFLTEGGEDSDEGLAAINFGGSRDLPDHPTAEQIYRLRELFVSEGREDLTAEIDLVWIPGDMDPNQPFMTTATQQQLFEMVVVSSPQPATPTPAGPHALDAPTPPSAQSTGGLQHDPTNGQPGGPHDQTGGENANYATRVEGTRRITIDRSRCHVNVVEPHKFWCYGARGWRKWTHAATMNWGDANKVAALNKHREQTHQRGKWPALRTTAREDYTREQREWVMERVNETQGERPLQQIPDLLREFNRVFGATRSETGMQSLVDRLRKEWHETGGQGLATRRGRGWAQRARSQVLLGRPGQKRKARDDDEESEDGEDDGDEGDE